MEIKQAALVLVQSRRDGLVTFGCLAGVYASILLFSLLIGFTKLGYYVVDKLHNVEADVGITTKQFILYICLYPLLDGTAWLLAGVLLRHKCSVTVGIASVADIFIQIGVVAGLLQTSLSFEKPILIPIIALYAGCLMRICILVGGFCKFVSWEDENSTRFDEIRDRLSARKVLGLWLPLALVRSAQGISRPITNLIVARSSGDEMAVKELAVLTLVYPVGRVSWGWLNELKTVVPAFLKEPEDSRNQASQVTARHIRIFTVCCLAFAMTLSFVVLWIPAVLTSFLTTVLNIQPWLAELCIVPMRIFTFCAIPVTIRAYVTSWLLLYKQTKFLAPSAVLRVAVLILALIVLPFCGVHGASQGIGALLASFCGEVVTAVIGYLYVEHKRKKKRAEEEMIPIMENVDGDKDNHKTNMLQNED
ncbi:progressive ankylosis protein homolog B-like [Ptychodera flava]|uniref:progressive ankylosis protein homolog B-like n=1 Tax=Ptychodera flava TaxID=63121 RepID=UPI00396A3D08